MNTNRCFGPHRIMYNTSANIVFSSLRMVRTPGDRKVYVYLETD